MSRLATAFVLGYHGCDKSIGHRAVNGEIDLLQSNRDYDWLGPGAYFWESDPQRALEWANWKTGRGEYLAPFVIGSVIDLRNCLDLVSREDLDVLKRAHEIFLDVWQKSGDPMPQNKSVPGQPNDDLVLRYLDNAVIRYLHEMTANPQENAPGVEPYDTVRGMFVEGDQLFQGSGFKVRSHVQIAVLNLNCIRGLFVPRPFPAP